MIFSKWFTGVSLNLDGVIFPLSGIGASFQSGNTALRIMLAAVVRPESTSIKKLTKSINFVVLYSFLYV